MCDCSGPWDIFDTRIRRKNYGGKPRKCCECGRPIKPGQKYRQSSGLADGQWWNYSQCDRCQALMKALDDYMKADPYGECVCFERVHEDLVELYRQDRINVAKMSLAYMEG